MEDLLEENRRVAEEKRKLRDQFADYREEINDFLNRKAYEELLAYVQSDKMGVMSKIENEAAIMRVVLSIWQMEEQEGITEGILTGISDLESAVERYLKVKFFMWRLEFLDERSGLSQALDEVPISVSFLKYLVHTSSFDKMNTSFKLAMLLKERGRLAQAFAMLHYVNELNPGEQGEELVLCEMADICITLGQMKGAAECLGRIHNPSGIFAEYQEKWGI